MKLIRKLSLTVLAVAIGMTIAGGPPALAESTSLCATDEAPCAAKHQLTHVHLATFLSGTRAKLLTSASTVECDVMFLGAVGALGSPQLIEGNFTYWNCGGCTVTEETGPTGLNILKEGHETAKVTGEGIIHVVCKVINCSYSWGGLVGTAKGPLLSTEINGEISIQEQAVNKVSGLLCPTGTAKLDILLTTEIAPRFTKTESGATAMCAVDPGTGSSEVCPSGNLLTSIDQQTLLGAKARLLTSSGTVECEVNLLGVTVGTSGTPLEVTGSLLYECGKCTMSEESGPYVLKFSKLGHETADVTAKGELHVVCSGTIDCYYNAEGLEGTAKGPLLSAEVNGEISFEGKELKKVKGTLCPTTAKLDLVSTTPSGPYISS